MLTLQEGIVRDELLDVDGRNQMYAEARRLLHEMYALPYDAMGMAQTDRLLARFPEGVESKTQILVQALRQIWKQNPDEKIVVFATYLATVEIIQKQLDATFPGKGVDALKGGDHGAKTAAQKRFRRKDGPKILICTAAGREGINLQFARILFNYDLPWNPMDLEQRIGRIHRYGQVSTSQVYNLVAADTIEGSIYLLLEEKLDDIAKTLGKVDEQGQVAEDLRIQVLGQLGSTLSYDRLYQEAVRDPTLKRTRQELAVAMDNADKARRFVFELFQDLDRFNLGDYQKWDDQGRGMKRLVDFTARAAFLSGWQFTKKSERTWELVRKNHPTLMFTTDRDTALQDDNLQLLGLEHPVVAALLREYSESDTAGRAVSGKITAIPGNGLLMVWKVTVQTRDGQTHIRIVKIGIDENGLRTQWLERIGDQLLGMTAPETISPSSWRQSAMAMKQRIGELLHKELVFSGSINEEMSYLAVPLALVCVER